MSLVSRYCRVSIRSIVQNKCVHLETVHVGVLFPDCSLLSESFL